jgi:hypothetical protein
LDKKITIADEIVYVGYYLGLVKDWAIWCKISPWRWDVLYRKRTGTIFEFCYLLGLIKNSPSSYSLLNNWEPEQILGHL